MNISSPFDQAGSVTIAAIALAACLSATTAGAQTAQRNNAATQPQGYPPAAQQRQPAQQRVQQPSAPTAQPTQQQQPAQKLNNSAASGSAAPLPLDTSPREVIIELALRKRNFPLNVRIAEVHPQALEFLGRNQNVKKLTRQVSVVEEPKDLRFKFSGPGMKALAMIIENPTDKPFYFFAAPHESQPVEFAGIGYKFRCLCHGETFRIKPKHTWIKVMELKVLASNRSNYFRLIHDLVGLAEHEIPQTVDE